MSQDPQYTPEGLWTEPNPISKVPDGALSEAQNVVIRRAGECEPRNGFKDAIAAAWTPTADQIARRLVPFDGDVIIFSDDASTYQAKWLSDGATIATPGQPPTNRTHRTAEHRGNLYICTLTGIQKITGATDDAATLAGGPIGLVGSIATSGSTGTAVTNGKNVAVRWLIRREDANGVVVRGQPSSRIIIANGEVDARDLTLTIPLADAVIAGDVIEVYRSAEETTGTIPSDELALTYSHEVTAAEVTAASATITDPVPTADRGAALYTSPGQQGLIQQNAPLPYAVDIATHRGSLFYAGTKRRHQKLVTLRKVTDGTDPSTAVQGFGAQVTTGATFTTGSKQITGLASTTGLHVGMVASTANDTIPINARINSIDSSSSVTLSEFPTGNEGPVSMAFCDWIGVGSETFYANGALGTIYSSSFEFTVDNAGTDGGRARGTAEALADCINTNSASYYAIQAFDESRAGTETLLDGQILIMARNLSVSQFALTASGGPTSDFWDPTLPLTGSTVLSDNEDRPGRLYWSKRNEPEHVAPVAWVDVGDPSEAILRILSGRDALWIWKTDGVWRLTGAGADSGWRVDPIDPNAHLIAPESAVMLDGAPWGWTDKGVGFMTTGGFVNASATPIGTLLGPIETLLRPSTAVKHGAHAVAYETEGEYWLGVPSAVADDAAAYLYVFNTGTKAWTRQLILSTAIAVDASDDKLVVGIEPASGNDGYTIRKERKGETYNTGDRSYSVTVTGITGVSVTMSDTGGWSPAVGDTLTDSGWEGVVVTVTSSTKVDVDNVTGAPTEGWETVAYEGYPCVIEHRACDGGQGMAVKRWLDALGYFATVRRLNSVTVGVYSDVSTTASSNAESITSADEDKALPFRFWIPRAHAVSSLLWPKLTITAATAVWRYGGCSIVYVPVSTRARRAYA